MLRARTVVHSWDSPLSQDAGAFKELQREGLAVVTNLPSRCWVAELGDHDKEVLEAAVPTLPLGVGAVDEELLRMRMREEPMREAGRASYSRNFDTKPIAPAAAGQMAGWTFRTLHPRGSGLVYGWVSLDARTCSSWSTTEAEAAADLLLAREAELAATGAARTAANAVHPGPHCFRPVHQGDLLLGYTFRLTLTTTGACAWVTADGSTVGRRVHQYPEEAAASLAAYLRPAGRLAEDDARTAARRVFPRAYNLLRVYRSDGRQSLLGWAFHLAAPLENPRFGWITAGGRLCDAPVGDRDQACRDMAAAVALDTPWTSH